MLWPEIHVGEKKDVEVHHVNAAIPDLISLMESRRRLGWRLDPATLAEAINHEVDHGFLPHQKHHWEAVLDTMQALHQAPDAQPIPIKPAPNKTSFTQVIGEYREIAQRMAGRLARE